MNFKQWLNEWEGDSFDQESDLVNGPQFPGSKYKGKFEKEPDETGESIEKANKQFGFTKDDPLLKKNMKKKCRKS